jgi:hypothetical protein
VSFPRPTSTASPAHIPRSLHLALFVTGVLWLLAAHAIALRAADGIATRFNIAAAENLIGDLFLLFLLLVGFTTLNWIGARQGSVRQANALPRRPTVVQEWSRGAFIGWAAMLVAVLPMMLLGSLHPQFSWSASAFGAILLSLVSLAVAALANEVAFRGFLFRRLIDAVGPTAATLLLSGLYALLGSLRPNATGLSFLITIIAGILFSLAYLRTRALWLGWGLHFAWAAATAVLFGLPVGGMVSYGSIVQTAVSGPTWFTGGAYGPEAAFFTGIVLLVAMAVVYRVTRDYAWNYTQPLIIPAGYPMDIPPPAAHTAMEQETAAKAPTLIQIAPASGNGNGSPSQPDPSEPAHHG